MPSSIPSIGLSSSEAKQRLQKSGANVLPQADRRNGWVVLLSLLSEPMLLLLLAASALYLVIGDPKNAAVLGASVLLVIALTLFQELRAERALAALRDLSSPRAHVWRDQQLQVLPASQLVLGDCVEVAEGDRVPADLRVLHSTELKLDESLLTGESIAVEKSATTDTQNHNILLSGSLVVHGRARAEVIAIGADTEIGRIGISLRQIKAERTPLQQELRKLVAVFFVASALCSAIVVLLHVAHSHSWSAALLGGITLAMATIPEEFPVVLTVFLALGAWRISAHRVLVRRAPAIEALGSISVLCTDKTGTLTENRMTLIALAKGMPEGMDLVAEPNQLNLEQSQLNISGLSSATVESILQSAVQACPKDSHDAMDQAIQSAWQQHCNIDEKVQTASVVVREYPISAKFTAYTIVSRSTESTSKSRLSVACKGAPETVLALCALDAAQTQAVLAEVSAMTARGLRVLAAASGHIDLASTDAPSLPESASAFALTWQGLLGFKDPLRDNVPEAVARAQAASVRVLMLTGDHLQTAKFIAAQAGIHRNPQAMLGSEFQALDAPASALAIANCDVFARVRPEHKLRIVETLKARGEVVAMTGDGVNDAPALRAAHVGIAMGGRGTDVARESAAIVLLDDDFASIVKALALGRRIYQNVRRASGYIIAVHMPIAALALIPLLLNAPLVLLPLHVVFLELVIDPACAIVLEREPAAPDSMSQPPREQNAHLLDSRLLLQAFVRGLTASMAVFLVYFSSQHWEMLVPEQAAMTFIALVVASLNLVNSYREARWTIFPQHIFARSHPPQNRVARDAEVASTSFIWMALCIFLVLAAIAFLPMCAHWFGFSVLSLSAFLWAAGVPVALIVAATALGEQKAKPVIAHSKV
jgi:P-type Ca2+ transporter type 2C